MGTANVLEVAPQYNELLKDTNVKFIQGSVSKIDVNNKLVSLESNEEQIEFDELVISVGARPRIDIIPGAKEFAIPFYNVDDAYTLSKYLRVFKTKKNDSYVRIAVIGGGYSGVEVATSVAQSLGKENVIISIIDRNTDIMHTSPSHNRITALK